MEDSLAPILVYVIRMSCSIHPTAVVHEKARLGENVVIGPYCVVYAGVTIGDGTILQNHVTVDGPTEIGKNNHFYAYSSIGQRTQDLKYAGEPTYLVIGDGNTFREFSTVHRGTAPESRTVIGHHGNFLSYTHVAHDCIVGDHVILSNNGTLGGHVVMGDHAILGGLTAVHQFCRIGAHAMTGGCSKIVQDIPPYMIADGNPGRVRAVNSVGLTRRGFSEEAVASIKKGHRILYREKRNVSESLDLLRQLPEAEKTPQLELLIDFVANSERGLC